MDDIGNDALKSKTWDITQAPNNNIDVNKNNSFEPGKLEALRFELLSGARCSAVLRGANQIIMIMKRVSYIHTSAPCRYYTRTTQLGPNPISLDRNTNRCRRRFSALDEQDGESLLEIFQALLRE